MKNILVFTAIVIFAVSCKPTPQQNNVAYNETPTRGKIKIDIDESFKILMDSEVFMFQASYKYADITARYKSEYDVIQDFLNDSVKTVVTAQKLSKQQEEYLIAQSVIPKTTVIATDAIAFIVNRNNPDSLIKINVINQIFVGRITDWKQINKKSNLSKIEVVFDNNKSANARYFTEKLNLKNFTENVYTATTNAEVINYVEKTPNAIGVISVNWISENTDEISNNFLKRVRVVGLTSDFDPDGEYYYKPYPAYIADKSYPFTREIYMITRETFDGLGSGFIRYVAGEKGQRIILKAGLVPATMPIRLVNMKSE